MLAKHGVEIRLNTRVTADVLKAENFDEIVVATGIVPRKPQIPGVDHPKVLRYDDVLSGRQSVGGSVAILGAGGIGFYHGDFLVCAHEESLNSESFYRAWGVSLDEASAGGLKQPINHSTSRVVHMFQRKAESMGRG